MLFKDFLVYCRNLLDPTKPASAASNWDMATIDHPLETDAAYLSFLAKFDFNVPKAMFFLSCQLNCGKGIEYILESIYLNFYSYWNLCLHADLVHCQRLLNTVEKTAANMIYGECRERWIEAPPVKLIGAFTPSSHYIKSGIVSIDRVKDASFDIMSEDLAAIEAAAVSQSSKVSKEAPEVTGGQSLTREDSADGDNATTLRASARVSSQEKPEARKRWLALMNQAAVMMNKEAYVASVTAQGQRGKADKQDANPPDKRNFRKNPATLLEAQALLDEAAIITLPFQVALASTGSAAQSNEDFLNIENCRLVLGDLVKVFISSFVG